MGNYLYTMSFLSKNSHEKLSGTRWQSNSTLTKEKYFEYSHQLWLYNREVQPFCVISASDTYKYVFFIGEGHICVRGKGGYGNLPGV